MNSLLSFYKNKKVLITGHTGFKGSWMCKVLNLAGANVIGYSLQPQTEPNLFTLCSPKVNNFFEDIRDFEKLNEVFQKTQPEIVIHMAAQPIVRESYKNPIYTYQTNVMGTVNILECLRLNSCVKSFVNVTTDKVYLNKEWTWGYRENEELNGFDPYSNSKSCSELVTSSYKNSFFQNSNIAISTCRAGNVIVGGDFSIDRIIPDCIRSATNAEKIIVRNPYSTRPYQHVLEPVCAYLMLAKAQYENIALAGNYNIGPDEIDCWTTGKLVDLFCSKWQKIIGTKIEWENKSDNGPHEANFLKLDCSKIKAILNWKPRWNVEKAMEKIVEWTKCYLDGENINFCMEKQIEEFLS